MKEITQKLNKFLDIIFPPNIKCIYCGEEIKHKNKYNACDNCLNNLPFNNKKICQFCGAKIEDLANICFHCFKDYPPFKIARAPFLYEAPISQLVQKYKFNNAKYLFKPLAEYMIETYKNNKFNCDVIVPVPLSNASLKKRHYNQSEELAKVIAEELQINLVNDAVIKIKETQNQATVSFSMRKKNVSGAYHLKSNKKIKGKNVLVVDDVMTTGETIRSVCSEILKGRPKSISVLTLAHTQIGRKKIIKKSIKLKLIILKKIKYKFIAIKNNKKIINKIKLLKKYIKISKNNNKKYKKSNKIIKKNN